jgi:hypothetical protein
MLPGSFTPPLVKDGEKYVPEMKGGARLSESYHDKFGN